MAWNDIGSLRGPKGEDAEQQFHLLTFNDGWPDRPDDDLPAMFVGGVAPDDAPLDSDLRTGDYWLPGLEPGGIAGGGGGGGLVTWGSIASKPSMFPPSAHAHSESEINGLTASLGSKEPAIGMGTNVQFWRGDKTWQALTVSDISGLGTAAVTNADAYASAAQGVRADSAVQPSSLADVALSGDYDDLGNTPEIPPLVESLTDLDTAVTGAELDDLKYAVDNLVLSGGNIPSDWDAESGPGAILNRPDLADVAFSGSYDDLVDAPEGGGGASENPVVIFSGYSASVGDVVICVFGNYQVDIPDGENHGDMITLISDPQSTPNDVDVQYFALLDQDTTVNQLPMHGAQMTLRWLVDIDVSALGSPLPFSGWYAVTTDFGSFSGSP